MYILTSGYLLCQMTDVLLETLPIGRNSLTMSSGATPGYSGAIMKQQTISRYYPVARGPVFEPNLAFSSLPFVANKGQTSPMWLQV